MPSVFSHAIVGGDSGDPLGKGARPLCGDPAPFGVGSRYRKGVGCRACLALLDAREAAVEFIGGDDSSDVSVSAATLATKLVLSEIARSLVDTFGEVSSATDPSDMAFEAFRDVMGGRDYNPDRAEAAVFELWAAVQRFHREIRKPDTCESLEFKVPAFPDDSEVSDG